MSTILAKAKCNCTVAEATVKLNFTDIDFVGEPWLWFLACMVKKPKRNEFIDEMEIVGRWSTAFNQAIQREYGRYADPADLCRLNGFFIDVAHEYFCWLALGSSETEARRTLRTVEVIVNGSRKILDLIEARIIREVAGETAATEFIRMASAGRLRLPARSALILNSSMRLKNKAEEKTEPKKLAPAVTISAVTKEMDDPTDLIMLTPVAKKARTETKAQTPEKKNRPGKRERGKAALAAQAALGQGAQKKIEAKKDVDISPPRGGYGGSPRGRGGAERGGGRGGRGDGRGGRGWP